MRLAIALGIFAAAAVVGFLAGYGTGAISLDLEVSRTAHRLRQVLEDPAQNRGA